MERLQVVPIGTITEALPPESKSWVASRFAVVDEGGIAKRRCRFVNCNKEYSRGTSHMILKRHWSRSHGDQWTHTQPSLRLSNTSNQRNPLDDSHKRNKRKSLDTNNPSGVIVSASKNKTTNQFNKSKAINNNTPTNSEKIQLDKLVAKRLKEASSIHITFDIYTAKKGGKSYGIITALTPSDAMEIKSVLLEYKHLPYPDDSTTIYEFLRSCIINKFNIREKIVSLVSYSSDIICAAVQEVDKKYKLSKNFGFTTIHIKCFPQFIHLNVIEVLRSQEAQIEQVRKVVSFINNNNFTLRPLQQDDPNAPPSAVVDNNTSSLDSGNKATGLKLPFDNRGSWNTTYNMIDTFIQQRGFIEPTLLYFQNPQDLADVNIDWDRLFSITQLLKPFYDVVNKFVVDNLTPVSLVAACIPRLIDHLASSTWAYNDLVMVTHNFKLQLEAYRHDFHNDLTVIAGLLDPRIKSTFIDPEGRDQAIDLLRKRLDTTQQIKTETHGNSLWSRVFRPVNFDEVADYLDSPQEPDYTTTVAYWESHKYVYPRLYTLARTIVCIQATSVPSDRIFSAAENADRERRIPVDNTNSKELMKSWARFIDK